MYAIGGRYCILRMGLVRDMLCIVSLHKIWWTEGPLAKEQQRRFAQRPLSSRIVTREPQQRLRLEAGLGVNFESCRTGSSFPIRVRPCIPCSCEAQLEHVLRADVARRLFAVMRQCSAQLEGDSLELLDLVNLAAMSASIRK
jgi:hypothetical protein